MVSPNQSNDRDSVSHRAVATDLLVDQIFQAIERDAATPVLVTPPHLQFLPAFFVDLGAALLDRTPRRIRIDWYRDSSNLRNLLSDTAAKWREKRIQRCLARCHPDATERLRLQITHSIGRPGGPLRPLTIGWCRDGLELPAWTLPIHLATEPLVAAVA